VFGTSEAGGTSGAVTDATGIEGGDDDDDLENAASLNVESSGSLTLNASSYTFGGTGDEVGSLSADTRATGVSGGDGSDHLRNAGELDVAASTTLGITGNVRSTFGTADAGALTTADTLVTGIGGDDGVDFIKNLDRVGVASTTTVTANRSAYVFGGTAGTDVALRGGARATGISGGASQSWIRNEGTLDVDALSALTSTGGAKSTIGGSDSTATAQSAATATGIATGNDADHVRSSGRVDVTASSDGDASNNADGGWLTGDGDTGAKVESAVQAVGLDVGGGDDFVANEGALVVVAQAAGAGFAYSSGAHLSWDGDGEALGQSQVDATAAGIRAGAGANEIVSTGTIDVLADATTRRSSTLVLRFWSEQENPSEDDPPVPIDTFAGDALPTLPNASYPAGKTIYWSRDPRINEEE
jgi:hypothetical protein